MIFLVVFLDTVVKPRYDTAGNTFLNSRTITFRNDI
ncbi:MAG TPA: palindromic element RPE4 domain-containing protein [Rickettsia endosymbiont of Pyrocoelia pectoralis]|nr:palindromic element RPE4 domain-containing protein [Rickettsia endosymbiont of Pyrocoelia pectoralis]